MRILGIESSCDETSAAIIEGNTDKKTVKLLSNVVTSSLNLHKKKGGIIPEIAAREQVKYIIPVIKKTLALNTNISPRRWPKDSFEVDDNESIDAIAVTVGPGLIGSLLVGVETAKTLAYIWKKPIVPVNHLIGHIYANWIRQEVSKDLKVPKVSNGKAKTPFDTFDTFDTFFTPRFPCIAIIVSGGHTDLVLMRKHDSIKWLGGTRDDAAGEAFDKIGRLLGLPYPGGPSIEKAAKNGNPKAFNFPRPMIGTNDLDFSFSGLKTSVLNLINKNRWKFDKSRAVILGSEARYRLAPGEATPESPTMMRDSGQARMTKTNNKLIYDLAASVQQAVIDVLVTKTLKAAQKYKVKSILLGGGVAANQSLREKLNVKCQMLNVKCFVPPKNLCTDNAAMIATAAFFNYKPLPWQKLTANPELYFD